MMRTSDSIEVDFLKYLKYLINFKFEIDTTVSKLEVKWQRRLIKLSNPWCQRNVILFY